MGLLILLIEDNEDISNSIAEILELEGYRVVCVDNGANGLKLAGECNPDMILSDISMPDMDGFTVCEMVKLDPALSDIPFIFLTAKSELKDREKAMLLGCDDYLVKPFDDVKLLDAVKGCFIKKGKVNGQISGRSDN